MFTHVKNFYKQNKILAILLSVTFVLILTTGIIFKQYWLKLLPLFISLIIMALSAKVNRYSFLLGSFNSLLYCYYYFSEGLMSNLLYAILVSFPLQLISFFTWHRKSKGSITELKKMTPLQLVIGITAILAGWATLFTTVSLINGASYSLLDSITTTLGITITILSMLRFSEYALLQIINGMITIFMHVSIFFDGKPENITYIIFSVYSFICVIMALVRMHKTHRHIIANRVDKQ